MKHDLSPPLPDPVVAAIAAAHCPCVILASDADASALSTRMRMPVYEAFMVGEPTDAHYCRKSSSRPLEVVTRKDGSFVVHLGPEPGRPNDRRLILVRATFPEAVLRRS